MYLFSGTFACPEGYAFFYLLRHTPELVITLWPDQFGQLEERRKTHREWLETVENATFANQIAQLTFLD